MTSSVSFYRWDSLPWHFGFLERRQTREVFCNITIQCGWMMCFKASELWVPISVGQKCNTGGKTPRLSSNSSSAVSNWKVFSCSKPQFLRLPDGINYTMQVWCESKVVRHGKGLTYFTFRGNPRVHSNCCCRRYKTVKAHSTWKEGGMQHLNFSYTLPVVVAGFQKWHPMSHAPGVHTRVCFAPWLVWASHATHLNQQSTANVILGQFWTQVLKGLAASTSAFLGAWVLPQERPWEDPTWNGTEVTGGGERPGSPQVLVSLQSHLSANTREIPKGDQMKNHPAVSSQSSGHRT